MAHDVVAGTLTKKSIDNALKALVGWTYDQDRLALFRHIELHDFAAAFGLMAEIAILAERIDHHPEWANVYNRIDIWLTTHDQGGVSQRDVEMARQITALMVRRGAS